MFEPYYRRAAQLRLEAIQNQVEESLNVLKPLSLLGSILAGKDTSIIITWIVLFLLFFIRYL